MELLAADFSEDGAGCDAAVAAGLGPVAAGAAAEPDVAPCGGASVVEELEFEVAGFELSGRGSTAIFDPGLAFWP